VQTIVLESYAQGKTTKSLASEILDLNTQDFGFKPEMTKSAYDKAMAEWGKAKRKAQFIARDRLAKLNGDITQAQQEDAGVTEYVWSTSGDGRVRNSHAKLNGTRQKWSEPPIVDELTGRRAHPGKDYRCRCVSLPVFDIEGLDLPWVNSE
jgi:SPP1 gp7 family putative phage head morphogenesis protein